MRGYSAQTVTLYTWGGWPYNGAPPISYWELEFDANDDGHRFWEQAGPAPGGYSPPWKSC